MTAQTLVGDRPSQGSLGGYPKGRRKRKLAPAQDNNPLHGTTIELFEEDFAPERVPSPKTPWSSARHLLSVSLGVLIGSLTCLGLWAAGLEPPASWRVAGTQPNISPQDCALLSAPETGMRNAAPVGDDAGEVKLAAFPSESVPPAEIESEYLEELSAQLDSAREDARQARRRSNEALVTNTALEHELQNAFRELKLAEAKLREATTRANRPTPPPVERLAAPAPAPRQPDQAFLRYKKGLQLYQARRYGEAESEFLAAIASDDQDARYHYYLGLCRLELGKRGPALEGIQRGVQLEHENKPSRVFVILALEAAPKDKLELLRPFRN